MSIEVRCLSFVESVWHDIVLLIRRLLVDLDGIQCQDLECAILFAVAAICIGVNHDSPSEHMPLQTI